jgi:hypothetical protein
VSGGKHEARAAELVTRAKQFNDAPSLVCLASMYQVRVFGCIGGGATCLIQQTSFPPPQANEP